MPDITHFRPVRGGNVFEETVARLLQIIRLGIVAPGGVLPPERELATLFEVSRDTVREAIASLTGAGFLLAKRGRYGGTFVCEPLPSAAADRARAAASTTATTTDPAHVGTQITDVLIVREVLEVGAARAAAERPVGPAESTELRQHLLAVSSAAPDDYRRLDSRLHLAFGELAGSSSLVTLLAENRMLVNSLLDGIPLLARNISHSNDQHERIVAAVLAGDREAAGQAMREHLAGTAALLHGFLA
ncbi:FadR/GntR family transcriptional regulator [Subtercola vilae]|uniref:FadR family transcriptional regulator n=1 Tax=Subtercola vilae TaxID=2056433 RepID=A0A4T2BL01_9MICO|nr:FCD domain-containing protein [Subtercola vilae]TIH32303.1 FadR family transcriptional regulator [Subtercola vilae]